MTSAPEDFTSDDLSGGFPGEVAETENGTEDVTSQEEVDASSCLVSESTLVPPDQENSEQTGGDEEVIPKGTDDNTAEDRKLFVGGLSWETKEPQLKEYFEQFGEIESVNLKLDPVTGRSRCFAFLVFKESCCVDKVLAGGEHAVNSKKVDVKRAKAKPGKIFVGGLTPDLEDEHIKTYFTQFGNITECEMPFDKTKNQRKNFCFITFEREETMKELLKSPKQKIGDVEVDVKRATPKSGYRGGPGYGGEFYGYMDYYYGYPDYYGWGPGGGGGGKQGRPRGAVRSLPY